MPYTRKLHNVSYFEAARRWKNRSILCVCEDFYSKADAKRATLGSFLHIADLY